MEWFDIFPPPFLSTFSIMEVFYTKCLLIIGLVWLIFIILAPKTQPEILTLSSYSLLEICETWEEFMGMGFQEGLFSSFFFIVFLRGVYFDTFLQAFFSPLKNWVFLLRYFLGCLCSAVRNCSQDINMFIWICACRKGHVPAYLWGLPYIVNVYTWCFECEMLLLSNCKSCTRYKLKHLE